MGSAATITGSMLAASWLRFNPRRWGTLPPNRQGHLLSDGEDRPSSDSPDPDGQSASLSAADHLAAQPFRSARLGGVRRPRLHHRAVELGNSGAGPARVTGIRNPVAAASLSSLLVPDPLSQLFPLGAARRLP